MNANVSGDSTKHDVLNSSSAKEQIQIGRVEGSFAGLVDDGFAFKRRQFRNNFPAWLTTNEDFSARTGIADSGADALTAPSLVRRQVRQIRTVAFARVHDVKTLPRALHKNALNWRNWSASQG